MRQHFDGLLSLACRIGRVVVSVSMGRKRDRHGERNNMMGKSWETDGKMTEHDG